MLMCKKNFACVCLATFRFLFYCVPHQERTRLQIYTQIYRIAFRKIKRPIFLSFLEPSDGSYNDDDQTIIAIQAGLKSVDRSMQYLRSWSNRHPGGRKKKRKMIRAASKSFAWNFVPVAVVFTSANAQFAIPPNETDLLSLSSGN